MCYSVIFFFMVGNGEDHYFLLANSLNKIAFSYGFLLVLYFIFYRRCYIFLDSSTKILSDNFLFTDETDIVESSTPSNNVRKDLNEWQAKHATLILSAAKVHEIFYYACCMRITYCEV